MRCIFMCRSLTYAQRAARVLEREGITAVVSKAPQKISGSGCAYCVKLAYAAGSRAAQILRKEELLQGKIYLMSADGSVQEVSL